MPAVVFPQIRLAVASIAISLCVASCGGTSVAPSEDIERDDVPTSNPVVITTVVTVAENDAQTTDPAVEDTKPEPEGNTTDTQAPAATTTSTSVASSSAETTTTIQAPATTAAPASTTAPPTTFEVITEEPSNRPPEIETIEPNA